MLKGPKILPQSPSKRRDQENAVKAFHPGNASFYSRVAFKLTFVLQAVATASKDVGNLEKHVYSVAEGKKRAIDEDEEATATEGETSVTAAENLSKRKRNWSNRIFIAFKSFL